MEPGNIIDFDRERRRRGPRFDGGLMDILEVSRDLVCLCRGGCITAINGAGIRLLGARSNDQLLGRRLNDFLTPETGAVMELFLAGKASEDKSVPTRLVGLDHSTRAVEMQVYRAREIAPDATVVVCRDITPDGAANNQSPDPDARFSLLIENAMNLVCHVRDGQVAYLNPAGIRLLGGTRIGQPVATLFHPDYAPLFEADAIDSLVAEPEGVPMRLRRLDGTAVDVLVAVSALPSAAGTELMVEARDISPQLRAVKALRKANETLEIHVAQRTRELAEQRRLADEARNIADAARRFTESLLDMIPSPVWFKDARGQYQACNRAFRDLFGCDPARMPETVDWVAEAMPRECGLTDSEMLAGEKDLVVFDAAIDPAGGERRHVLITKSAYVESGRPVGILGVITDITERKAMEGELRRLATTDPLTGAANRRHFMDAAHCEIERAIRYDHPLSVVMLDIDHFKRINDTHGHAIGDEALKAFADAVQGSLRDFDVLGRLGGEEFAVILPETAAPDALGIAERLRTAIAAVRVPLPDGGELSFTSSLGVATHTVSETAIDGMLARADAALYLAKQGGRNRVVEAQA